VRAATRAAPAHVLRQLRVCQRQVLLVRAPQQPRRRHAAAAAARVHEPRGGAEAAAGRGHQQRVGAARGGQEGRVRWADCARAQEGQQACRRAHVRGAQHDADSTTVRLQE
jgi:hypothetical protein